MTAIPITDDVRITSDGLCVTIERRSLIESGKNAGEYRWSSVGFYGTVEGAAQALVGRHHGLIAGLGQDANLRELISSVKRAEKVVADAVRGAT